MPKIKGIQSQIKSERNFRKCADNRKDYGDIVESIESMKKLPTIADILGHFHYLGKIL